MHYHNFGRTGVKVSGMALGCMNFGGRTDEAGARGIIDMALDAGINFFDTANVYGHNPGKFIEGRGRSEVIVGKALRANGQRARVFLATKVFYPMSDDPNDGGASRRHIIDSLHASLERLQTDHVDLLQMHSATPEVPVDETLRALDDLVRSGKVRYIGVSGYPAWQLVESLWVSKEYGLNRVVSEQPPYNLLDRRIERELIPMAQTYGLAILPWAPIAGGFLSGRYRRDEPVPEGSRFDVFWRGWGAEHRQGRVFDIVEAVEALAAEKGCTAAQLALAWVIRQPGITSAITGPRTAAQMADNLAALEIEFSAEDLARLDEIAPPGEMTVPYYGGGGKDPWVGWGKKRDRW